MNRKINYILMIIGGLVAFYAQAEKKQNEYLLIAGIVLLMLGIYRLARTIPSKKDDENTTTDDNHNINN
jgi:putative Mn2+ efflux pump MntP